RVRLTMPINPKASWFEELHGGDFARAAGRALTRHLPAAPCFPAFVAKPGPANVLNVARLLRRWSLPVQLNTGARPHEAVDNDLGARRILADGNVRIATRIVIPAISRRFPAFFLAIALPVSCLDLPAIRNERNDGGGKSMPRQKGPVRKFSQEKLATHAFHGVFDAFPSCIRCAMGLFTQRLPLPPKVRTRSFKHSLRFVRKVRNSF